MCSEARVVAATHQPLKQMVEAKTYREDLYFRLNVLSHELPPLRERRSDIPLLIEYCWNKLLRELGRTRARPAELTAPTREALLAYHYPGNVRELQNVIERLLVMAPESGQITPDLLPREIREALMPTKIQAVPASWTAPDERGLESAVDAYEEKLIHAALEKTRYHRSRAAKLLKLTRRALQYKLKKHGLVLEFTDDKQDDEAA